MQRRVYLALDESELRRLGSAGVLDSVPRTGYAVTADLRRGHPGVDEEELEYLAFTDAARSGRVPVVAAADLGAEVLAERGAAGDDESPVSPASSAGPASPANPVSRVRVSAPVLRRQVVSFHVAGAPPVAGVGGIPEFSWYDATELDVVVDLLAQ